MHTSLLQWTASFLRPYLARIVGISALSITEIGLAALAPWTLKLIVDNALTGDALPGSLTAWLPQLRTIDAVSLLIVLAISGLVIQLASEIARMVHTQLQVDMGQRVVHDLRSQLLAHLQALPMAHHTTHRTSDSVYRIDADAYCINDLVTGGVFPLAIAGINLLVMFTILLQVDAVLAFMTVGVTPFLYLCLRFHTSTLVDRAETVKIRESWLIERVYETLRSIAAIKSFTRENHEHSRFVHASEETIQARLTLTWQESLFSAVVTGITLIGTASILIMGGIHVLDGTLRLGTLLVVIAYIAAVYDPISSIAHTIGSLQQAVVSADRVRTIFSLAPEILDKPNTTNRRITGRIAFRNVSFSYDRVRMVLEKVTFDAHPGEIVAIVGLTGAGKTTLVNLIPRLFDTTEGRILIDDVEISEYGLRSLRNQVALAPQTPVLLAGTFSDNIRFGHTESTDEAIVRAAQSAQIHDFIIGLPEGYNTTIGEDGATLSGGERQRIGIARAFLKEAPILVLDEPTSSLDSISEAAVFESIRRSRVKQTTLVIAHRLSTIRDADQIIVVDQGRVSDTGTHESLLKTSRLYRRLWEQLSHGRTLDERALFHGQPEDTPTQGPS